MGHLSALLGGLLGLVAVVLIVMLGLRLRPWQNSTLDADALMATVNGRWSFTQDSSPTIAPSTPALSATPLPTSTSTYTPTSTASPTPTVSPTLTATQEPEPTGTPEPYVVVRGDTLLGIAAKLGVSLDYLLLANDLDEDATLSVGQRLVVSVTDDQGAELSEAAEAPVAIEALIHEVVSGDTLLGIASAYGVDTAEIARANGISETAILRIGQELEIPVPQGGTAPAATRQQAGVARTPLLSPTPTERPDNLRHIVVRGDTLGRLAMQYDVAAAEIAAANGISVNAVLSIGQQLLIPGTTPEPTITVLPSPTPTLTPLPTQRSARAAAAAPTYAHKYVAPRPLSPHNGERFMGADDGPLISWVSVGILSDNEWYRLRIWPTSGVVEDMVVWTKATSWRLDRQEHRDEPRELNWQVQVATRARDGKIEATLSEISAKQSFMWY